MDITYLLFLQNIRESLGGIFDSFIMQMTALGEGTVTYLLLAAVYWCWDKRSGQYMGLNVGLACTMNQFLKAVFRVERPWVRDERIHPLEAALPGAGGYSFPSGHTQRAAAVWGAFGVSLWEKKERFISAICWSIVILIAFARNYVGVHTPQDVIAALVLGVFCFFITDKAMLWADKGDNRDIIVAAAGCILCFLPMLRVGCLSNAGAGMGFFIGWVLERHFINFETEVSYVHRCMRFAVGGAGIVFIMTALKNMLQLIMESKYAGFFMSFALAIFIMAVYPFFFCRKERYKAGIAVLLAVLFGMTAFSYLHQKSISGSNEIETDIAEVQNTETEQEPVQMETEASDQAMGEAAATVQQIPKIIAHRGYSGVYPENTMSAFRGALDIGTDYIELDVQLTKDGQVVVSHDDKLLRTTGVDARIADLTYEELQQLDAGGWFDASFAGEKIPTLQEVLELVGDTECKIYLELKDIGEVEGFEEAVLGVTDACHMTERCLFASFQYNYLIRLKELDAEVKTLYNTTSGKLSLPEEFPADYYGLNIETATAGTVETIHQMGKQAFVWTVNTPAQMKSMQMMGVDGIVTNEPGLAKVICQPQYQYLADNYEKSFIMPGLYGALSEQCTNMVVQGFTKAGNLLIVSAYSKAEGEDSILYVMNMGGKLQKIVDLGFRAHTGGIAYDEEHDLLWVTGPEGMVYAIRWSSVLDDTYQGEIQVSFDAGLLNHNEAKVASFLTYYEGELFVGSYVDGASGTLNRYDLADVAAPVLLSSASIPERIQGITFQRDMQTGEKFMLLSQSYQTEDSALLRFVYEEQTGEYVEPAESHVLPEGAEQIQITADGLYILFESACRPYRETAGIPNDRIYVIRQ